MPRIVITHGRSLAYGSEHGLKREWGERLRDGLSRPEVHAPYAETIPVDLVFYGDLYRRDAEHEGTGGTLPDDRRERADDTEGGAGNGERGYDAAAPPSDVQVNVATDLLARGGAGADLPPELRERTDANADLVERFGWDSLTRLVRGLDERFHVGEAVLRHFLQDLHAYLTDNAVRDRTVARLRDRLAAIHRQTGDEVILLAHSMGSIVAYDLLMRDPDVPVRAFISFGSPLGLASFRRYIGDPPGNTPFPPRLPRWINLYNPEDFATADQRLAPLFRSGDARAIVDQQSDGPPPNATKPIAGHSAEGYLSSVAMGRAVQRVVAEESSTFPGGGGGVHPPPPPPGGGVQRPAPPTHNVGNAQRERGGGMEYIQRQDVQGETGYIFQMHERQGESGDSIQWQQRQDAQGESAQPPQGQIVQGHYSYRETGAAGSEVDVHKADVREVYDPVSDAFIPYLPFNPPDTAVSVGADRASVEATGDNGAAAERGGAASPSDDAAIAGTTAASPPQPATRTITRNTAADFPSVVDPETDNTLTYRISTRTVGGRGSGAIKVLDVPVEVTSLPLTVSVATSGGFDVIDPITGKRQNRRAFALDLTKDDETITGEFVLRSHPATERQEQTIYVNFSYRGMPVGSVTLPVVIATEPVVLPPRNATKDRSATIAVNTAQPPPTDLVIHVNHRDNEHYDILIDRNTGANQFAAGWFGTMDIKGGAATFAREVLSRFRGALELPTPEARERRVKGIGIGLWGDLPELFRDYYWEQMHGEPLSVTLYSDEPYIPWELIVPQRPDKSETAPMFGVSLAISRWKKGLRFPNPLRVSRFAVVAPQYATNALKYADDEATDLQRGYGARRIPGEHDAVCAMLDEPGTQALHFSGHGGYDDATPDNSYIRLEPGKLDPDDINAARVGASDHPLVFLNACEVGREGWSLTNIGGWATTFCDAEFSVFVGPYWRVNDRVAREVARIFYAHLRDGETVARAMQAVRRQFAQPDDAELRAHPTWLAYAAHSQPNMTVEFLTPP